MFLDFRPVDYQRFQRIAHISISLKYMKFIMNIKNSKKS